MPAATRSPQSRPDSAPAYLLADGALAMKWTTAEGAAVHRETGGNQAAYACELSDHDADALTPAGV
jgi:hypothetical protein